jgi:CDP-6-deoxy-D-xylo-4-hexulose-3-dehydrase
MSDFSFYYAHHLTTVEGGMISTDDPDLYETLRMLRAHGLVREASSDSLKQEYRERYPDLNPEFTFAFPAYNVRSTEINAVIGRSQLKRLDASNRLRVANLGRFLHGLDPVKYRTEFRTEGNCNYALTLVVRRPDDVLADRVMEALRRNGIEFRRGTAGGGNQLRQPYLRKIMGDDAWKKVPEADHVHFYGFYIGNFPGLEPERIDDLCALLNALPAGETGE